MGKRKDSPSVRKETSYTKEADSEEMDLLRYSETKLDICFKGKGRREINDVLRQLLVHPDRIRICPCVHTLDGMVWVRKTLAFLHAHINNEPSHQ